MLLADLQRRAGIGGRSILGTDISDRVRGRRQAIFPMDRARPVAPERRKRFACAARAASKPGLVMVSSCVSGVASGS